MVTKKKALARYKTSLIDELAFYKINGLEYRVSKIASRVNVWSLERTPEFEKLRRQFWSGSPRVSLKDWITIRTQIKYEHDSMVTINEVNEARVNLGAKEEIIYWCVINGKAMKQIYGRTPIHKERIKKGNFFKTEAECLNALLPSVPVDNSKKPPAGVV